MRGIRTARIGLDRRPDDGIALVAVIGTMAVLTLFLLTTLTVVTRNAPQSRREQDAKAALAAAQAGVQDYVSRLNANDQYFTQLNGDATNAAFSATGRSIAGATGSTAMYRYQVLDAVDVMARRGKVRLRVTGTSGPVGNRVSRTVTALLEPNGFLKYVYLSDVEVTDPELTVFGNINTRYNGVYYSGNNNRYWYYADANVVKQICGSYYYAGRAERRYTVDATHPVYRVDTTNGSTTTLTTGTAEDFLTYNGGYRDACADINWTSDDVVAGPLHSNDALLIGGAPLFTDPKTETGWATPATAGQYWWGGGAPSASSGGVTGYRPVYAAPIPLPTQNSRLIQYTTPGPSSSPTTGPGCYYTGQTRIRFTGTQMEVWSPQTTNAPDRCLTVSNRANAQTKAIPPVIYVAPSTGSCTNGALGYPRTGEDTSGRITTDYSCNRGTALVSGQVNGSGTVTGTVDGQVTIGAKDDIVITGNLETADNSAGDDVIGLVADNYVWVYHPVEDDGDNLAGVPNVFNIDAAILALNRSFIVQNYNEGEKLSTGSTATKLNVTGSISQKFRGPVGTGGTSASGTGYLKNYDYDERLRTLQPPYFLQPANSWRLGQLTDG